MSDFLVCKECKNKLLKVGVHKEAPEYNKYICPYCDK
jgi:hypothetical protein